MCKYKEPCYKDTLSFIGIKQLERFGCVWSNGQLIENVLVDKINKTRRLGQPKTRCSYQRFINGKPKRVLIESILERWILIARGPRMNR